MTHPLYDLLKRLESGRHHFHLGRHRPDSILVSVTICGERIEIDVFDDGHAEMSRFKGNEDVVSGWDAVDKVISEFGG